MKHNIGEPVQVWLESGMDLLNLQSLARKYEVHESRLLHYLIQSHLRRVEATPTANDPLDTISLPGVKFTAPACFHSSQGEVINGRRPRSTKPRRTKAVCQHCGRGKRSHIKSGRLEVWYCKTGFQFFEPIIIPHQPKRDQ